MSPKTFKRRLERIGIHLPPGYISPKYQKLIYKKPGKPFPNSDDKDDEKKD